MSGEPLRRLGTETFGQKLRRARNGSGVNLRSAAELISREVLFVSHTTLARLEEGAEPPSDPRRRQLACLTIIAYGYDPDDFGLSLSDLPRSVNVERFLEEATALGRPTDIDAHEDGDSTVRSRCCSAAA